MKKIIALCFLITGLFCTMSFAEEDTTEITGYFKTLHNSSRSQSTKEDFFITTNRLRLEFNKQINPWQFYLTLDNEALIHDAENLPEMDLIRSRSQDQLATIDLDKTSVDNEHLYLRHSIYRAYVKYYQPEFQAVVGKQSIDWGRLRFYSPADIFNAVGALDIEHDERVGIDAVNLNFTPEAFAGVNVVAAPAETSGESSGGIKIFKTISTYDAALIAASVNKDQIYGVLFDGYLKSAGFRGEITHTIQDGGRTFPRAGLGLDYTFNDKLYALVEYFYNGGHDDNDPDALTSSYRASRQILSLKKHLTSIWLKYSLTALFDFNQYIIYDTDGRSVVINPELSYDIAQNIDLSLGIQYYSGNAGSEFGDSQNLYYAEFKWFF
jgi:hypothetical protein